MFDPICIQQDFPILSQLVAGKKLVYLDNAATTQKPEVVIDAISEYYRTSNANVHRGIHTLGDTSTRLFEQSRQTIATFLGAHTDELIFCRNTTEALNGVAYGWADHNLATGDVILVSLQEHHSNLVVWQEVAQRTGAAVEFIALSVDGTLDLDLFALQIKHFNHKIKLIALTHVSNTLGIINPISEILYSIKVQFSSQNRPKIVLDAAQSVPHIPINFSSLGVDFLAFSGHKMLAPMGSSGLIVKKEILESGQMQPWLFGGGMIDSVTAEKTNFAESITDRFTAGTPDVASAVGLAAACEYLQKIGMHSVFEHDHELVSYTLEELKKFPHLTVIGPTTAGTLEKPERIGSVAFIYEGVHAHDVAQVLSNEGVAVRSGHHCTMPLHLHFKWQATTRISFQIYTTKQDIDDCIVALKKVATVFIQ